MDSASSKPADLVLPATRGQQSPVLPATLLIPGLPLSLVQELWRTAEAEACDLTLPEFAAVLVQIGDKLNHGLPPGASADPHQKASFFRSLHLADLALAHACALGHEAAWERFLLRFRSALVQAAIAITASASLGHEIADSLYAELYGLRAAGPERCSPLATYSGRGSLLGWLRTTLVQRFRDHHRRTHRESPLDSIDSPAAPVASAPPSVPQLVPAIARVLKSLDAEDRFLLAAYFLDRQTLLQIARTLHVHEATVSRRIKRLTDQLHKLLLDELLHTGLSPGQAEEALGADPRDIEINLRALLQTSQISPFSSQTAPAAPPDTA